jgi:Ax21 family sulfation-dependent quorum factor
MKRILLAVLAVAVFPLASQASDLSYTYVEGGYTYLHNDNVGHLGDNWGGSGSVAVGPNFFVFGGGSHTSEPVESTNGWNLGGGFHTGISSNTDFVADVNYAHTTVDGLSGDSKGYIGEVGVRSALSPQFEGWLMAGYENGHADFSNPDSVIANSHTVNTGYGKIGGQYKFNKNWGLVAEARVESRGNQSLFFGPRISF